MANAGRRWKEREAYGEKDKMKRWIAKREKERGRILRERGYGRGKGETKRDGEFKKEAQAVGGEIEGQASENRLKVVC